MHDADAAANSKCYSHATRATASTTGTAMAAVCPLLWCPLGLGAALLGVTNDSVDVATIVAFVPAASEGCVTRQLPSACVHEATAGSTVPSGSMRCTPCCTPKSRSKKKAGKRNQQSTFQNPGYSGYERWRRGKNLKACSACSLQGNANTNYCSNSCMTKCQVARHTIPGLKQTLDTSQCSCVVGSNNISHLPLSELTTCTDVHIFTGAVYACIWHQYSVADQICMAWHDSIAQHIPEA